MRITELELENFAGVKSAMKLDYIHIDFNKSKNKICLIVGPNGKGKTVLLSQLQPFATLGTIDERDALPIIQEGKSGHKKIVIIDNENEYVIDHFYSPSKKTHTVKSFIKKNGEELNPNGNVTSFKECVKTELELEQEYMKLVRLGNSVVNMIDLKSAERKAFMSKLLDDTNIYLKCYKKINTELSTLKTLISHSTDELNKNPVKDLDESKEQLTKKKDILVSLKESISKLDKDITLIRYKLSNIPVECKKDMEDAYKKLLKLNKKTNDESIESLKKDKEYILKEFTNNEEKIKISKEFINNELNLINSYENDLDEINNQLSKIELNLDIDGIDDYIKELTKKINELDIVYADYTGKINYTKEDINNTLVFLKEKQNALNNIYSFGSKPIKEAINIIEKKKDISEYIMDAAKKDKENNELKSSKKVIQSVLSKYNLKSKPSCDNCVYKKIIDEFIDISKLSFDSITYDDEYISYIRMSYLTIKEVINSFTQKKDLFEKLPKYIKESFIVKTLLDNISKCQPIYNQKDFFNELAFITDYENYLNMKVTLDEKIKEKDNIVNNSSVNYLLNSKTSLENKLNISNYKYNNYKNDYNRLIETNKKYSVELENIDEYIEILEEKDLLEEKYKLNKEYVETRETLLKEENDKSFKKVNLQRDEVNLSNEISKLEFNILTFKNTSKYLKTYRKFYDSWVLLKNSLSPNDGIPLIFIDMYLKKALSVVNDLLDQIYSGEKYVSKFDINENSFTIPFIKDGKEIPDIRYASDGEKSFFSITLSFAISFQSMSKYNIMLLDELDSVLDESNRSNFIAMIERLLEMINAEQLFIISHNNMFSSYPVDAISIDGSKIDKSDLVNEIIIEK